MGSPLAILEDAKAFLANPGAAQTPPRSRKPSLDANKLPFVGSSEDLSAGQRRLPSLSIEEFQAIKRREGVDSRCSDPGARGASRGSSHTRRKHRHPDSGGIASAPASRGYQAGDLDTPVHFPEPPMTEPADRLRASRSPAVAHRSPLVRHASSPAPFHASPDAGSSTPSLHSSKRPPQAPVSRRSMNSRERRPGSRDTECIHSPVVRMDSPAYDSPAACLAWGSPTSAKAEGRESSVRREKIPVPVLEPEPEPRQRRPRALPGSSERQTRSAAQLPSAAMAAEGAFPKRQEPTLPISHYAPPGVPDEVGSTWGNSQDPISPIDGPTSVVSAPPMPMSVANCDLSILTDIVRTRDGWDLDDQNCGSQAPSARRHSSITCTVGPKGITSLLLEAAETGNLAETMSAQNAVRGSTFVWTRGEVLGRGTLGVVYKALDQRTGQMFAVKEVRIDKKLDTDMKFKKALEMELSIYKELLHPHIVSYLGHDYLDSNLYIYLEYMPGGSVAQVLSQFGPFDETLIGTYARELLEGLEYLHTRQPTVLHRDIKGANILVGLDCKVKLSDFGCSKRTADTFSQSLRGSIPWMAPEVINQSGYGRRSDIWSFGCVLIEMATTKHPWGNFDNPMAAMIKIGMSDSTPPVPDCVSELCQGFIRLCTQRDRNLRPLASTLLRHEFVQMEPLPD